MGGTIRASLHLGAALAEDHDVLIVSVLRRREEPFFSFPGGVRVAALEDRRPRREAEGLRMVRNWLRRRPSLLMAPSWRPFEACSLWTDVQLARRLRGRRGLLVTTAPSLNLLAAEFDAAGWVRVAQEHMHFAAHHREVRASIRARYPRLDALVVLTERDARDYAERVPGLRQLAVIPNGVRRPAGPPASSTATTVLGAGRLTRQKGFDRLVAAWAMIADRHPDWRLRITGRGPQRPRLQAQVQELGLAGRVELARAARDLEREMRDAAIFVLSSRFEGFPLTLLEAMSVGLAVVSFDCPTGPGEFVEDHRNGLLVPAGDSRALAAAIEALIEDPALRRRLGAAAAQSASAYTLDAVADRWRRLISDLAARPAPLHSVARRTAAARARG